MRRHLAAAGMMLLLVVMMVAMVTGTTAAAEDQTTVTLDTPQGSLKGLVRQAGPNRHFYSFRGIPYAEPPIGPLRFKDPVAAGPWSGVRGSFDPPQCPQIAMESFLKGEMEVDGEEDCLYLHVYTPKMEASALPVMVFIHGGGYVLCNPDNAGGGPMPLMTRDVVLVSMQYRLGTLGFLSTEDDVLPGNLGLKDQTLALRWVQKNIDSFGGDPSKVTIFGESAGGGSVHQQILAPSAAGLFHRAIMQSGNSLCPWAIRNDHLKMAGLVGKSLECPGVGGEEETKVEDSQALLQCLQEASVESLVLAQSPGPNWNMFPFYMVPRVDGEYIPDHPARLVREGRYNQVDIISGVCAHEGAMLGVGVAASPDGERLAANFSEVGPIAVATEQEAEALYLAHRIFYHYLGSKKGNFSSDELNTFVEMASNVFFTVPHDTASLFHARDSSFGKNYYMYELQHVGKNNFIATLNTSIGREWVSHGDDTQYLSDGTFGFPPITRGDDLVLRDIFLDLWTNFAATGTPTPDLSLGFKWSPASVTNLQYLSLTPAPVMKEDTRTKIREFHLTLPTTQNKLLFPEKFQSVDASCQDHCHP